ncbi:hypothetical protein J8273_2820 [Carpediemonas membranifera]|uniref:DUF445 domain-containing protein n=1 Tax=Carpediemonas membranifera TaxID=201153 RepID=A0A8J6B082_9EUKA|nr:hypothetical protein J8273_2820 [Carpediemonas membranifera]|eukprot:KAG9395625.1 hypothetical protein J8273_2820 [Carpediemonas membranifera]
MKNPFRNLVTKGNIANGISFLVLVIGLILKFVPWVRHWFIVTLIFNAGLFGFSGGVTNSIAIKMLFDRVPFLIGSGIIPRKFKLIRTTIRNVIINTFFDTKFLADYVRRQSGIMLEAIDIEAKISALINSRRFDSLLDSMIAALSSRSEGMVLEMVAGGAWEEKFKRELKPLIVGMTAEFTPMLVNAVDPVKLISEDVIKTQLEKLMDTKLQELTPTTVKHLVEDMIRSHLGMLVIWGNVFGTLFGVLAMIIVYVLEWAGDWIEYWQRKAILSGINAF